jgi:hypothetical protein
VRLKAKARLRLEMLWTIEPECYSDGISDIARKEVKILQALFN